MTPESTSTAGVLDHIPVAAASKGHRRAVTTNDDPYRCLHRYPNGGRCRLPGLPRHSGLCLRHFQTTTATALTLVPSPSDSEDLSADLLPELSEFEAAFPINQFLSRLLILVTKGRITPRSAAVLAYITNQLLHSQRAIQREQTLELAEAGPPTFDFTGWPGPDRTDSSDLPHPDGSETSRDSAPVEVCK